VKTATAQISFEFNAAPALPNVPALAPAVDPIDDVDIDDHDDTARELLKVIDRVHDAIHDFGAFRRSCDVWWALLQRHQINGEERYLEAIKGMPRPALDALAQGFGILIRHFCGEGRYCDILGRVYMEISSNWGRGHLGQFFTPWSLAMLMAQTQIGDQAAPVNAEGEPLSISDCACGAGVMLLAARGVVASRWGRRAASRLRLYGQDIDGVCVTMAKIQIQLTDDRFTVPYLQLWAHEVALARKAAA